MNTMLSMSDHRVVADRAASTASIIHSRVRSPGIELLLVLSLKVVSLPTPFSSFFDEQRLHQLVVNSCANALWI